MEGSKVLGTDLSATSNDTSLPPNLPPQHGTIPNVTRGTASEQRQNLPPQKPSFSDLFKDQRRQSKSFSVKLWKEEERNVVKEEDLREMGACLIGYILGRFPGMKEIEKVRASWKIPHTFVMHESGWMLFKFSSELDRDKVLEGGPYETYEDPWLIKAMPMCFAFDDTCFGSIPTWIRFPGLPLHLWSEVALGKLMSHVGIPLAVDDCTANMTRISFARALVEVDATKPLVKEISFTLPNGEEFQQQVLYERAPIYCSKCRRIGHDVEHCKGKKYVPRKGQNTKEVQGDNQENREKAVATQDVVLGDKTGQIDQAQGRKNNQSVLPGNSDMRRYARSRSRTRDINGSKDANQGQKVTNEVKLGGQNGAKVQEQRGAQNTPIEKVAMAPTVYKLSPCQGSITEAYVGKGKDKGKEITKMSDKGKELMNRELLESEGEEESNLDLLSLLKITKKQERRREESQGSLVSSRSFYEDMADEDELEEVATPYKPSKKLSKSQKKKQLSKKKKEVLVKKKEEAEKAKSKYCL